MRKNNDPALNHKRKAKGKRGSNDDSYPLHSIETIVAKNKSSDSGAISDRYNLQTLLKNGTDIEAHSVYKKSKSSKSKKSDAKHAHSKVVDQQPSKSTTETEIKDKADVKEDIKTDIKMDVNSTTTDKVDTKADVKANVKEEIKEEHDATQKIIKQENTDSIPVTLKNENTLLDDKSVSTSEQDKSIVTTEQKPVTKTENQNNVKMEKVKQDENIAEDIKQIKTEEQSNVKIEQEMVNDSSLSDKVKDISSLINGKINDIKVSESTPTSPVTKKRKRGRPSRASKSNTASPLSSTATSVTSSPIPSKIDYSLYGVLRTSRRLHHGTFEKKCVQCNSVISPKEYAKNGVICGHCWKLNFKD
ncbi:hypothetical protein PIROE2DRAFT_7245 [Piromyces sp. E2]|nr:hypothetical protein PIROE2DRAFT_7245 [Piromyces sp. E2]|eukprot:OUM65735.1 hypothetical protein PIROE2DRAFT_7245 [Piromyces sp. E2]